MALINPGDWPIDPNVVDGTELAARLNRLQQAIISGNANATRPPYLQAGSVWAQIGTTPGDFTLNLFDGTADHVIGSVIGGVTKFGGATFNSGATATKPATSVKGDMFYDTTLNRLEVYDGGAWKTNAPANVLNGATSGSVTLVTPAVAGSNTATFPAATGIVLVSGNMPCFKGTSPGQTLSNSVDTKLTINEDFDTNNCFASDRFTPNVPGYYLVHLNTRISGTGGGSWIMGSYSSIAKNGSGVSRQQWNTAANSITVFSQSVVELVAMNGTTDYLEAYVTGLCGLANGFTIEAGTTFSANFVRSL